MNDLSNTPSSRRTPARAWPLTVVDAFDVAPGTRRVRAVSDVDGFSYQPGQDLMLRLPRHAGERPLRAFTVHAFDAIEERLDIDFAVDGDHAGAEWARQAKLGDRLEVRRQRDRSAVVIDWRLALGAPPRAR